MKVNVMAPICEGKMTLDLDFVDFCQFSNVFKVKGVFSNFFIIFWDFLDFWLVQPPKVIISSTPQQGERMSVGKVLRCIYPFQRNLVQ